MQRKPCRRARDHAPHAWGVGRANWCLGVPPLDAADFVLDALENVMFRVAMLRDLTVLPEKDRRALDAAYSNLSGVSERRRAAR